MDWEALSSVWHCVWQTHLVSHPREFSVPLLPKEPQLHTPCTFQLSFVFKLASTLQPEAYLFQHKILQFLLFIWVGLEPEAYLFQHKTLPFLLFASVTK